MQQQKQTLSNRAMLCNTHVQSLNLPTKQFEGSHIDVVNIRSYFHKLGDIQLDVFLARFILKDLNRAEVHRLRLCSRRLCGSS